MRKFFLLPIMFLALLVSDSAHAQIFDPGSEDCIKVSWWKDGDGDGWFIQTAACSTPGPGWTRTPGRIFDCNDNNPAIYPGAIELCDGVDNNCNNAIDEGFTQITYYQDADGDGYSITRVQCFSPGAGWSTTPGPTGDCNDNNAAINPGATEVCDGIDNDCDFQIDEGFTQITYYQDADGDGYSITRVQCFSPGAGWSTTPGPTGDCNDNNAAINPGAPEVCDGIDNNCNGQIDEGVLITYYLDQDGDGYGGSGRFSQSIQACSSPGEDYVTNNTDCNDFNPSINPGATEICGNTVDENCDGQLNEACCTLVANTSSLADVTAACAVASITAPTATSTCGSEVQTITGTTNTVFPITTQGTTVVTWSYISGNNTVTQTQNVIIDDVTPPVAPTLAAATGACSVTVAAPTAQDNCKGTITGTTTSPLTYNTQGTYSITWTFDDGNGNTSTATQSVVVDDVTAPVTPTLANVTVGECSGTPTAPTTTDACAGIITGTTATVFPITTQGTTIVTWTFNDGNGNSTTATQNVVVDDVTPPVANVAALPNVTVQCSVTSLTAPTATDNCKGQLTATTTTSFPITTQGTTVVTWTYNDGNGNTATQTQNVVIIDNTAPVVSGCPSNISINTGAGNTTCNRTATWTAPTATDNCTTPVTVTSTHNPGDAFPAGLTTVTYTFKDAALNTSTCSFTVTVIDNTPPTANALTAVNVQCISGIPAANSNDVLGEADNCGGVVTVAHVSDANNGGAGSIASPYRVTRTYSLTDARGNTTNITQTLTAIDNTAPVPAVATLADATGECSVTVTAPTATDNCKGLVTGTTTSPLTYTSQGTYSITWTFNDGNGNSSTQTQSVVVDDVTAPVTPTLANVTVGECSGTPTAPTTTDACAGIITGTPNKTFPITAQGTTVVTWTFSDGNGNSTTATQNVIVKDVTAPVANVAALPNVTVQCSVTSLTAPTATDNCKGQLTATTTTTLPITAQGTTVVTWTYNDGHGNTSTQTQNVLVQDVTAPVLTDIVPNQSTLWPPNHKMKDVTLTYSASDNCGGIPSCITTVSSNEATNNDLGDGNTEVDWEVVNAKLVRLRAERSGAGEGRVYTITVTCNDGNGNVTIKTTQVRIAHNITSPVAGSSVKIGSTINMAGTFWDVAGNRHTAKWLVDGAGVNGTVVAEPVGTKNGSVKGSYKLATAGVYKLQMNITDQKGVTSYATTSGYDEAIVVAYDPNGGYTYGGKKYKSPKGAMPSNPAVGGEMTYGFQTNYYKGATNPKGETWFILNNGEFEFNALNFEYLAVSGAKAQFRGLGKMNRNGVEQSGIAFILTVIDGQLAGGGGTDKIRMKIFNKNSGEIYYDSQMGASDADNPTIVVENNSLGDGVVVMNTTATTTANPVTVAPVPFNTIPVEVGETKFDLKAFPNPSASQFTLQLQSNVREKVQLRVTDISGRTVQMLHNLDANQTIQLGMGYRPGVYIVEMIQGNNRKQVKLIKR